MSRKLFIPVLVWGAVFGALDVPGLEGSLLEERRAALNVPATKPSNIREKCHDDPLLCYTANGVPGIPVAMPQTPNSHANPEVLTSETVLQERVRLLSNIEETRKKWHTTDEPWVYSTLMAIFNPTSSKGGKAKQADEHLRQMPRNMWQLATFRASGCECHVRRDGIDDKFLQCRSDSTSLSVYPHATSSSKAVVDVVIDHHLKGALLFTVDCRLSSQGKPMECKPLRALKYDISDHH